MREEVVAISRVEARQDNVDAVQAAYNRPLSEELRAAGCLAYDCYQHLTQPNTFVAIGRWQSAEAFQRHLAQNQASLNETSHLLTRSPELLILQRRDETGDD